MIKEGTGLFVAGRGEVVPYIGKYAVKTADVFDQVEAGFARAGLSRTAAAYRPLRVEFELTTRCNDSCPSCGMGAMSMRDGVTLSDADLDRLVGEFASIALPSVAVTGGEPFAAMRALKRVIASCARAGIDISKLTSNGWWGSEKTVRADARRAGGGRLAGQPAVRAAADAVCRRAVCPLGARGPDHRPPGPPVQRPGGQRGGVQPRRPGRPQAPDL